MMDDLIGLAMACIIMEMIIFTQRKNPEVRQASEATERFMATLDLMGTIPVSDAPQVLGLRQRLNAAAEKVRSSLNKKQIGVVSYATYQE